jgi:hypothetical protein
MWHMWGRGELHTGFGGESWGKKCKYSFGTFSELHEVVTRFVMLVCLHGTTQLSLDGFSLNLILCIFKNLSRIYKFHWHLTSITGTLHEDLCTYMIISRWILPIKSVSDKQSKNRFNIFSQNHVVYEVIWKDMVEMDRPQMTIQYRQCALQTR